MTRQANINEVTVRLSLKDPLIVVSMMFSISFTMLMLRLIDGDFINSYPFMGADSFDWVSEGLLLYQRVYGINDESWLLLREPVFVIISGFDFALNANGTVIISVIGLSLFASLLSIIYIGRYFGNHGLVIFSLIFCYVFMPIGFYKMYIFVESICTSLIFVSLVFILRYRDKVDDWKNLGMAFAFAFIAGMAQMYGAIPFFVIVSAMVIDDYVKGRGIRSDLLVSVVALLLLLVLAKFAWLQFIPHERIPNHAKVFADSVKMAHIKFTINSIVATFAPIIPMITINLLRNKESEQINRNALYFSVTILVFIVLLLVYAHEDYRLHYSYVPLIFAMLLALNAPFNGRVGLNHVGMADIVTFLNGMAYGVMGILFIVGSYRAPDLTKIEFAPHKTWVHTLLYAKPHDRLNLAKNCGDKRIVCQQAKIPDVFSPYQKTILNAYIKNSTKHNKL